MVRVADGLISLTLSELFDLERPLKVVEVKPGLLVIVLDQDIRGRELVI